MKQNEDLLAVLADLQKKGFVLDFELKNSSIECEELFTSFSPGEFEIKEVFSFELPNQDSAMIFAVDTRAGLKGIVIKRYQAVEQNVAQQCELYEVA